MAAAQQVLDIETTPTTFPLNYDCLFELFQWLDFKECMNFAEAYEGLQPVADRIYKRKFNKFTFDFKVPIDRIIYHAGAFLKSLTLILNKFKFEECDLINIRDTCKELQCLTLKGFNRTQVGNNPFGSNATDNLEVLTLDNCSIENDVDFFDNFTGLKCLNLLRCRGIQNVALKKCFQNNQGINSFTTCDMPLLDYSRLLQLLPNLERLSLRYNSRHMKLKSLSKLQSLRHLTLRCFDDDVNDILTDLAKINILEELVLYDIGVDENTFELIKSFEKLQLLVVTTENYDFPSSDVLPPKLETLKLGGFYIADNIILPLVQQLKYLEDFHISNCEVVVNDDYVFSDFDSIADLILAKLNGHTDGQLNIMVTSSNEMDSPKVS